MWFVHILLCFVFVIFFAFPLPPIYKHGKKELLTFLVIPNLIWCRSQILGVLILEIHLSFFSLSFCFYMSCKFTLEQSLVCC